MPANRSRTERWKQSLEQICERGGGLEFAVDCSGSDASHKDLVWRVRVHGLKNDEIMIEHPGSMGQSFPIADGANLIGIMSVGQNRWMFRTKVLGTTSLRTRFGPVKALRVEMPQSVERCQRRHIERTSTLSLNLPMVECWPLLDARSAVHIEVANRVHITDLLESGKTAPPSDDLAALPEVGPKFHASLANIGGGGVGLLISKDDRVVLDSVHPYWLRVDLRPTVPAPLLLTARIAHTHIDSQQNTYAGLAFDFALNTEHKQFVVGQVARYVGFTPRRAAA